jgi:hypothetical protein
VLLRLFLVVLVFVLAACGGAPAAAVTPEQLTAALTTAGATNIVPGQTNPDSPMPKSFTNHQEFIIPALGDKGGQAFICDTKQNCDAIYAYFDALKALAGPYLYRSQSGTVIAQLNSGLTPDQAKPFQEAIETLP